MNKIILWGILFNYYQIVSFMVIAYLMRHDCIDCSKVGYPTIVGGWLLSGIAVGTVLAWKLGLI